MNLHQLLGILDRMHAMSSTYDPIRQIYAVPNIYGLHSKFTRGPQEIRPQFQYLLNQFQVPILEYLSNTYNTTPIRVTKLGLHPTLVCIT